jgi:hypothetical protein
MMSMHVAVEYDNPPTQPGFRHAGSQYSLVFTNTPAEFVNALRRASLTLVPSRALLEHSVTFVENKTAMCNEFIASTLALLPLCHSALDVDGFASVFVPGTGRVYSLANKDTEAALNALTLVIDEDMRAPRQDLSETEYQPHRFIGSDHIRVRRHQTDPSATDRLIADVGLIDTPRHVYSHHRIAGRASRSTASAHFWL